MVSPQEPREQDEATHKHRCLIGHGLELIQIAFHLLDQLSTLVYTLQADLLARLIQVDPHRSHSFQDPQLLIKHDVDNIELLSKLLDCVKCSSIGIRPNLKFLYHVSYAPDNACLRRPY